MTDRSAKAPRAQTHPLPRRVGAVFAGALFALTAAANTAAASAPAANTEGVSLRALALIIVFSIAIVAIAWIVSKLMSPSPPAEDDSPFIPIGIDDEEDREHD